MDVVLLCTIAPFGKGCELFERFYGLAVSTKLARANELWELRYREPELFEPVPARLRQLQRSPRTYVMTDTSKLGNREGKRGRGAPRLKTLKKLAQQAKRKAIQQAERGKAGPRQVVEEPPEAAFADDESWKDEGRASPADLSRAGPGQHRQQEAAENPAPAVDQVVHGPPATNALRLVPETEHAGRLGRH